jgi:hypothetical protein
MKIIKLIRVAAINGICGGIILHNCNQDPTALAITMIAMTAIVFNSMLS